ncbi:putative RNA-directed DNA polymerase [Tanacetum coccineum]
MMIISLNVRGIGVDGKLGWVKSIIRDEQPNVIGLQETKCGIVDELWVEEVWGNRGFGFTQVTANGSFGGIILIWDANTFVCKEAMGDERLMLLMNKLNGAWCIFGDFNVIRRVDDRLNSQVKIKEMDDFSDFINVAQLVKIPMGGRNLLGLVMTGPMVALDRKLSDHCPIVLKDMDVDFGPKPFRVFDLWLEEVDIEQLVSHSWKKDVRGSRPDYRFRDKLKNVKENSNEMELEAENRNLNDQEVAAWMEARKLWVEKESERNNMLRQKARVTWDVEGDENTILFHSFVKRRDNKNVIRRLMVDGNWCEDPRTIKNEVVSYYKTLFTERTLKRPRFSCDKIVKISGIDADMLEGEIGEKEVWDAICGCGGDKAPGPDGFNFKYIKKFWKIINADLMEAVADPIGLGDFRPTSLIGCYYKILAKILAERVKKVVGEVMGDVQNAFIKGRFILDGVLIANETVEFLRKKKDRALVFKVDFKKAYNSINWKFLDDIMKRMGFGSKWCKWVENCLNSGSMSVLVNGSPTEEFSLERGVRQRDPLSPFLFILAAEGLNALVSGGGRSGYLPLTLKFKLTGFEFYVDILVFDSTLTSELKTYTSVFKMYKCIFVLKLISIGCRNLVGHLTRIEVVGPAEIVGLTETDGPARDVGPAEKDPCQNSNGWSKFTRASDDGAKFSKLDRFLMNENFKGLWCNLAVVALDRKHFDHCPIVLKDMDVDFGPKPFRVFDLWLEEVDIEQLVSHSWKKDVRGSRPDYRFRDKLKNVKADLKVWSKMRFGQTYEKIEEYRRTTMKWELEAENRNLNDQEVATWMEARKLWVEKESERNNMLRQKARVTWDVEGDENTIFFHSFVKRRNNKNVIRGLMVDGNWCEDLRTIKNEVVHYYKTLFTERTLKRPRFSCDRIVKNSAIDADMLEGEIGEKEETKEISRGCNSSFVTIIPKVADPIGLGDFRPISLIGCYYKILAKILAERVKKVVGEVVGDVQNAFMKGRFILDGVLIANETVELLRKKKDRALVFKVDFKKAYDSINWKFLDDIMKCMGFGSKWCKWVENCLNPGSMSVLVNGSPTEEFSLERGVRQGDSLSPFLFIYSGGRSGVENAKALMCVLKCFEEVSGLKVNFNKSKLYGIGVNSSDRDEMARWMRCSVGEFPFGLPIGERIDFTSYFICKVRNGRDVSFWLDKWVGDLRLCDRFPRLFHLDSRLEGRVAEKGRWIEGVWRDQWWWNLNENGGFTVKELTSMIEERTLQLEVSRQDTIWNKLVPKKVNIFVWRALKKRLPVSRRKL